MATCKKDRGITRKNEEQQEEEEDEQEISKMQNLRREIPAWFKKINFFRRNFSNEGPT